MFTQRPQDTRQAEPKLGGVAMNNQKTDDLRSFIGFFCFFLFLPFSFLRLLSSFNSSRPLVFGLLSLVCFVFPVISQAEPQVVLPSGIYQAGAYRIQPVPVFKEAQAVTVKALRDDWPDTGADAISIRIEVSQDGGKSWEELFGFKAPGGEIRSNRTGQVMEASRVKFQLPYIGHADRQIRGVLETYTTLSTTVSFDIE